MISVSLPERIELIPPEGVAPSSDGSKPTALSVELWGRIPDPRIALGPRGPQPRAPLPKLIREDLSLRPPTGMTPSTVGSFGCDPDQVPPSSSSGHDSDYIEGSGCEPGEADGGSCTRDLHVGNVWLYY